MISRKKLIEVALPLEAINVASAREKSIRHGHPSTLHLWWARRPLAAARAVIFAQMIDDPSTYIDVLRQDPKLRRRAESLLKQKLKVWEEARALFKRVEGTKIQVPEPGPEPTLDEVLADEERQRLFRIIEELVKWENTTNETVLQAARDEIWQSWRRACVDNAGDPRARELFDRNKLPAFHDPFAGGGALPLEAQRLGLESYASDLNPVAVLINKAMIEIPPKFAGKPPVNPEARKEKALIAQEWKGAQGLAADVRYYGQWMRDEAEKRIGHLYPKVHVTAEMASGRPELARYVGRELTVIAWLWARTVPCPNPACSRATPLLTSFVLSSRPGRECYLVPETDHGDLRFRLQSAPVSTPDAAQKGYKRGESGIFECAHCGTVTTRNYVAEYAKTRGLPSIQTAIVAEGDRGRVYLPASAGIIPASIPAADTRDLDVPFALNPRETWCRNFGLLRPVDMYSPRQIYALTTFSDLVAEARARVKLDAIQFGLADDGQSLHQSGRGAQAYADAVGTYLGFVVDKCSDYWSSVCSWHSSKEQMRNTFGRQAIPMAWDYAEANPLGDSTGNWMAMVDWTRKATETTPASGQGSATQSDAQNQRISSEKVVSTDPPYYNNIGYADMSDFFYVWLRRSLKSVYPDLFATLAVPKAEELVATSHRHGGQSAADEFFLNGMTQAMRGLVEQAHPAFPATIYYAVMQSETTNAEGTVSTGWDTFLDAVIQAGFELTGTWPIRTEMNNRMIGTGINTLASSIVLVCRPRAASAPTVTRREFATALKAELPRALAHLQRGNIAPVDLAQAAIGPGMGVFTGYAKVLDAEGEPLSVRDALALINQTLDEALAEQEGDFDADSRWALTWFEQSGFAEGEFGVAEQLSKSKNTSVDGMVDAGILESKRGKVRLLRPDELPVDWDPASDPRLTAWEIVHHLVRVLAAGGEAAAAGLVSKIGAKAESGRELAYRLYALCERKRRATEAVAYNGLVQSWPEITRLAREGAQTKQPEAVDLFGQE